MAKLSKEEIIEAIKELSVLELNDLVKACEEEFGVSAAAGVVVAAGPAAGGAAEAQDQSQQRRRGPNGLFHVLSSFSLASSSRAFKSS